MTDQPHAELRALLAAASTEGPWEHQCLGSEGCMVHIPGGTIRTRRPHVARFGHGEWKRDHANAEFTAAAHEMLPSLLADNARLRDELSDQQATHRQDLTVIAKAFGHVEAGDLRSARSVLLAAGEGADRLRALATTDPACTAPARPVHQGN